MLSSRNRYLILAVGAGISPVAYVVIATIRLTLAAAVCHFLGRAYGDHALRWFSKFLGMTPEGGRSLRAAVPHGGMGADPHLRRQQHRLRAQRHREDPVATNRPLVARGHRRPLGIAVVAGQAVRVGGAVRRPTSCSAGNTRSSSCRSRWSSSPTSPTSAAVAADPLRVFATIPGWPKHSLAGGRETLVYMPSIASRPSVTPGCSAMCLHARTTPGM